MKLQDFITKQIINKNYVLDDTFILLGKNYDITIVNNIRVIVKINNNKASLCVEMKNPEELIEKYNIFLDKTYRKPELFMQPIVLSEQNEKSIYNAMKDIKIVI